MPPGSGTTWDLCIYLFLDLQCWHFVVFLYFCTYLFQSLLYLGFHPCWDFIDMISNCKNQIVGWNLRIVAHWWTLCKSHLLRLYFGVFQPSVVSFLTLQQWSNEHIREVESAGMTRGKCSTTCTPLLLRFPPVLLMSSSSFLLQVIDGSSFGSLGESPFKMIFISSLC